MGSSSPHILFYDGVCGLCDRLVQFVLRRDPHGRFVFSPLQGDLARRLLPPHGVDPEDLDTVCLILDPDTPAEMLLTRSRAILFVLRRVSGPSKLLMVFWPLPTAFLDFFYDRFARRRYRWFGRHEACRLPKAEERDRFVGLPD